MTLGVDLETYSSIDITRSGVYKYVESPDFEVLLFAYSLNNAPVQIIDLTIDELPVEIENALTDSTVIKTSWNSNFERVCLAKHLNKPMPPEQWRCTMVHAAMVGLPLSLDAAAKVLKLDVQKDSIGKSLIRFFSIPCKPTKKNGERLRNLPEHAPEKWEQYKAYCVKDVEVEQAIQERLKVFEIPAIEHEYWCMDQRINDRGVMIDPELIQKAIEIDDAGKERLAQEVISLTGIDNPDSGAQLKKWLLEETGEDVKTLSKDTLPDLIKNCSSDVATRVLQIRQEAGNTSTSKYKAMLRCRCADNKVRGLFQYYGAPASGRYSSKLVQLQNLKRGNIHDMDLARELVRQGDGDTIEMLFGSASDILSQLIRTAFIAAPGTRLLVNDYSSIELVVAAWIAGEQWVLDEFNGTRKMYEQTAARMLHIPLEQVQKSDRQKGKVAALSCQYGGSEGALIAMNALKMGLTEEELPDIIRLWRKANTHIVKYWKVLENSAIRAVKHKEIVRLPHNIILFVSKGVLFIQLPSGRRLSYVRPSVEPGKFGNDALHYYGIHQKTKQWCKHTTWGGTLFNNVCQGTARDCLMVGMHRLEQAGYPASIHVHDEIVCQMPDGVGSLDEMSRLMTAPIDWAKGLPLAAAGFETTYYKKD